MTVKYFDMSDTFLHQLTAHQYTKTQELKFQPSILFVVEWPREMCGQTPGPFEHLLTLTAWISKHMPNKVWDEIIYPFPNLTVQPLKFENG